MTIVLCQCRQAGLIEPGIVDAALEAAKASGHSFFCVDDLCALAAAGDERFAKWAKEDDLMVLACFPRAISALFSQAGVSLPESATCINLRAAESFEEAANELPAGQSGDSQPEIITALDGEWQPWFPVIDYDRCKNCMQCLNFCLFGVYSQSQEQDAAGKMVQVARPNKCKTGCPACARVCPFAAIIFPKYDKSPINGDEVDENHWRKSHAESAESLKDRLSGNNIYQMLRNRGTEPTNPQTMADLEKLKDQFDIPDELFKK